MCIICMSVYVKIVAIDKVTYLEGQRRWGGRGRGGNDVSKYSYMKFFFFLKKGVWVSSQHYMVAYNHL